MTTIRAAIEGAIAYLSEHPDEARYTDNEAVARVESGLRIVATAADGSSVTTDMTRGIGGTASAPSPGWLLRAAEATCVATFIVLRAAQLGREVEGVEVAVDSESDDRGLLEIDPSVPAGPLSVAIRVTGRVVGGTAEEFQAIAGWAVDHCPVVDAVRRAVPVATQVNAA